MDPGVSGRMRVRLGVSAVEAIDRFRELAAIQDGTYTLERSRDGVRLRRWRDRRGCEGHERTVIELWIRFSRVRGATRAHAKVVQRPRWRGIAAVTENPSNALGAVLHEVINMRRSFARWRREKSTLLNLAAQALMPVAVADGEAGPYRDRVGPMPT